MDINSLFHRILRLRPDQERTFQLLRCKRWRPTYRHGARWSFVEQSKSLRCPQNLVENSAWHIKERHSRPSCCWGIPRFYFWLHIWDDSYSWSIHEYVWLQLRRFSRAIRDVDGLVIRMGLTERFLNRRTWGAWVIWKNLVTFRSRLHPVSQRNTRSGKFIRSYVILRRSNHYWHFQT